jgi:hypothetical protein
LATHCLSAAAKLATALPTEGKKRAGCESVDIVQLFGTWAFVALNASVDGHPGRHSNFHASAVCNVDVSCFADKSRD